MHLGGNSAEKPRLSEPHPHRLLQSPHPNSRFLIEVRRKSPPCFRPTPTPRLWARPCVRLGSHPPRVSLLESTPSRALPSRIRSSGSSRGESTPQRPRSAFLPLLRPFAELIHQRRCVVLIWNGQRLRTARGNSHQPTCPDSPRRMIVGRCHTQMQERPTSEFNSRATPQVRNLSNSTLPRDPSPPRERPASLSPPSLENYDARSRQPIPARGTSPRPPRRPA